MVENSTEQNGCSGCCLCFKFRKKKEETDDKETAEECANEQRQKANEFLEDRHLPYLEKLDKLQIGQLICITGQVNIKCRRFSINLVCSRDENPDIAFHFNPRLEQRYVVRNCRLKGYWGDEETCSVASFDFALGKRFKVDILVAEREFMVSVNGRHWCAFAYRVPLEKVAGLEIRGRVDIQEVAVKDVESYPLIPEPAVSIGLNEENTKERCMPFIGRLSKPFALGWSLEVCGRLKMCPQSFFINLQDGVQIWPHPIVSLHLNPRFCTTAGVDVFVRNAWVDGGWGSEERAPIFPFLSGADFKMLIQREDDHFTIWVAANMVAIFKFRGGLENMNYVYITGDLIVSNVTLRDGKADFQRNAS